MDSSTMIDSVISSKFTLSSEEMAMLVWRIVQRQRKAFEHFTGFSPLRRLHEEPSKSRTERSVADGVHIVYPPGLRDGIHCAILYDFGPSDGTLNPDDGNRATTREHERLLLDQDGHFLKHKVAYTWQYLSSPIRRHEIVKFCNVQMLSEYDLKKLFRDHANDSSVTGAQFHQHVFGALVRLATANKRARAKQAEKATQDAEPFLRIATSLGFNSNHF